jgi:hypothetical protein
MDEAELEKKIIEYLPKVLETKPEFKIEIYRILSQTYVTRDELQAYMKKSDKRWEELIRQLEEHRAEDNRRFEESNKRYEKLRVDMNERFEAMQQQMDKRFEEAVKERAAIREDMNKRFEQAAKERAAIREDMNRRFEQAAKERAAIREDMNRRFEQAAKERAAIREDMVKGFARLDQRIQKFRSKIGARIGERFEGIGRRIARELLLERGIKVKRIQAYKTKDVKGLVFEKGQDVEVDIFIKEPLVIGEIKSIIEKKEVVYNFSRKVKFFEKLFGKKSELRLIVTIDIPDNVKRGVIREAKKRGIRLVSYD